MSTVVVASFLLGKKKTVHIRRRTTKCCSRLFSVKTCFHFTPRVRSCGTRHQPRHSCQRLKLETWKWNDYTLQRSPFSFNFSTVRFFFFWLVFLKLIVELGFLDHVRNPQNELNCCLRFAVPSKNKQQFKKSWKKIKGFAFFMTRQYVQMH